MRACHTAQFYMHRLQHMSLWTNASDVHPNNMSRNVADGRTFSSPSARYMRCVGQDSSPSKMCCTAGGNLVSGKSQSMRAAPLACVPSNSTQLITRRSRSELPRVCHKKAADHRQRVRTTFKQRRTLEGCYAVAQQRRHSHEHPPLGGRVPLATPLKRTYAPTVAYTMQAPRSSDSERR